MINLQLHGTYTFKNIELRVHYRSAVRCNYTFIVYHFETISFDLPLFVINILIPSVKNPLFFCNHLKSETGSSMQAPCFTFPVLVLECEIQMQTGLNGKFIGRM